jgi:hypothetical protein
VFVGGRPQDGFEDAAQIADRHLLLQQLPEHGGELYRRHAMLDLQHQFAELHADAVEQEACFLRAHQARRAALEHFDEMSAERTFRRTRDERCGVEPARRGRPDPDGFFRTRAIARGAFHGHVGGAAAHQQMIRHEGAARESHIVHIDDIALGREPHIERARQARARQAEPHREVVTQRVQHAVERVRLQRAERALADAQAQRSAGADFDVVEQARHAPAAVARERGHRRVRVLAPIPRLAHQDQAQAGEERGEQRELKMRKARNDGERQTACASHHERLGLQGQLAVQVGAEIGRAARGRHARDEQARGDRDHQ